MGACQSCSPPLDDDDHNGDADGDSHHVLDERERLEREDGQRRLRDMVARGVEWDDVVRTAATLHRREVALHKEKDRRAASAAHRRRCRCRRRRRLRLKRKRSGTTGGGKRKSGSEESGSADAKVGAAAAGAGRHANADAATGESSTCASAAASSTAAAAAHSSQSAPGISLTSGTSGGTPGRHAVTGVGDKTGGGRGGWKKAKERRLRRRRDALGSFSINMATHRQGGGEVVVLGDRKVREEFVAQERR